MGLDHRASSRMIRKFTSDAKFLLSYERGTLEEAGDWCGPLIETAPVTRPDRLEE